MGKHLIKAAKALAMEAHVPHIRKYTGDPYIGHPARVAKTVSRYSNSPAVIAAAWLHDVIEDAGYTHDELAHLIDPLVASYVLWLSNVRDPKLNRAARKALDRERLAKAPPAVHLIKVADLLDNSVGILKHDPKFAPVFVGEMRELLGVLKFAPKDLLLEAYGVIDGV